MIKVDFKITTWERVNVPLEKIHEQVALLKKIREREIESASDLINEYPNAYLEQMTEVDHQMTIEENLGNPTIEAANAQGLVFWDNVNGDHVLINQEKKEREVIPISSLKYYSIQEFADGFREIDAIQKDFDGEKGHSTYDYIFQRVSDGKYFKLEYTDYGYNGDNLGDNNLEEVYPEYEIKLNFK